MFLLKFVLILTILNSIKCQPPQFNIGKFQRSLFGRQIFKFSFISNKSIGAIFDAPNSELELAFKSAVERSNVQERSFELVPLMVYVNSDDSFIMEKTGEFQKHKY